MVCMTRQSSRSGSFGESQATMIARSRGRPLAQSTANAGDYHPLRLLKEFMARRPYGRWIRGRIRNRRHRPRRSTVLDAGPSTKLVGRLCLRSGKTIRLLSAVNPREEVSFIAGEVKKALRAGIAADSLLVAFPSLDEYGPLVEELFTDCGIPYNRALGRQLSTSPVTTAAISLLRACHEEFSGPSLLRVLSSPFLKFGENRSIAPALDRFLRGHRIMGGKERLLTTLRSTGLTKQP